MYVEKLLVFFGLAPSEEERELARKWKYATEHFGAKVFCTGWGGWRLSLDPKKVRASKEFQEALKQAEQIMRNQ